MVNEMIPINKAVIEQALGALETAHYKMIDAGMLNQDILNKNFTAHEALRAALHQSLEHTSMLVEAGKLDVLKGSEKRRQNALWAQITDYEKRAKETKNDIKKAHYTKMAQELRGKLKTKDVP